MKIDRDILEDTFLALDHIYDEVRMSYSSRDQQWYFSVAYLKFLKDTGGLIITLYYDSKVLYEESEEDLI